MDEYENENEIEETILGTYDRGSPFGETKEIVRCHKCTGVFSRKYSSMIVGIYFAPVGEEAIKRQKRADEHNEKLDTLFNSSRKCECEDKNMTPNWLKDLDD